MKLVWSTQSLDKLIKKLFNFPFFLFCCEIIIALSYSQKKNWEDSSSEALNNLAHKIGTFSWSLHTTKAFSKLIKPKVVKSLHEWQYSSLCLMAKVWAQSELFSVIITRLIKAKMTAASTGLFAHNCQRGEKSNPQEAKSITYPSSISSASNRILK